MAGALCRRDGITVGCASVLSARITAPTGEGRLYEVDMRLRPEGNAGAGRIVAEAFTRYQKTDAWTWEHQALTRARVVCAEGDLGENLEAAVRSVLTARRDASALASDVAEMRERIRVEHGVDDIWSVKHILGGIVDIEFVAQYLQLKHAAKRLKSWPGIRLPRLPSPEKKA